MGIREPAQFGVDKAPVAEPARSLSRRSVSYWTKPGQAAVAGGAFATCFSLPSGSWSRMPW